MADPRALAEVHADYARRDAADHGIPAVLRGVHDGGVHPEPQEEVTRDAAPALAA